jgi:hypothetical protein
MSKANNFQEWYKESLQNLVTDADRKSQFGRSRLSCV